MSTAKADQSETRIEKWAALKGKWKFAKGVAHYLGPTPPPAGTPEGLAPVGLARASVRFRDGLICSKVKINKNEHTTAGFFVRFQSEDAPYAIAQIGAWDRAYAISEFQPGFGWVARLAAGSLTNLNINEAHEVRVAVAGQMFRLTVDDSDVLPPTFSTPMEGTGFGLYPYGDAPIDFIKTRTIANPPTP